MATASPLLIDTPKSLRDPTERAARLALLRAENVRPLSEFVDSIRTTIDDKSSVPYFDPYDGGINAECLFVLEAPGAQAIISGFVSRNNPDESAKNWFELNVAAGIDRRRTLLWNIVPWYLGSNGVIRTATTADIRLGLPYLRELLSLLPAVRVVVLVGKKAARSRSSIVTWKNPLIVLETPHPSPKFINSKPHHREILLQGLRNTLDALDGPAF